jgi:hypothetical protein
MSKPTADWALVAARGVTKKVPAPLQRFGPSQEVERPIITILYEDKDFQEQLLIQKAIAIAQGTLYNGSVLFSFDGDAGFEHRTEAYQLIQSQIGKIINVRPISRMGNQRGSNLILEVQFDDPADKLKAITTGVNHREKCYKGTPSNNRTASEYMVRLQLSNVPWSTQMTDELFVEEMTKSLSHYGRVCQLRKHTCKGDFFEGEVSVMIDVTPPLKIRRL